MTKIDGTELLVKDTVDSLILKSITIIRNRSKRPDVGAIFKEITNNSASNITFNNIEDKIGLLIKEGKITNIKTSKGLDSFFIKDVWQEVSQDDSDINQNLVINNTPEPPETLLSSTLQSTPSTPCSYIDKMYKELNEHELQNKIINDIQKKINDMIDQKLENFMDKNGGSICYPHYDHKSMIKSNELLTNENNFLKKEFENKNIQIEHLMELLQQSNNTTDCIKTEKIYDVMSESYGSSITNESSSQTEILNCSISTDIDTQLINIRKQHHKKYIEIKSKIKVPENINSSDKKKKNV